MARYLIEVAQKYESAEKRLAEALKSLGSHFVTHAHWEERTGTCIGSMIMEGRSEYEAWQTVPPSMRAEARIFELETVQPSI